MVSGYFQFNCGGATVSAQQHPAALSTFEALLAQHTFDRIIEIGTAAGGLAWWFRHNTESTVITYDINVQAFYAAMTKCGIDVRAPQDVFDPKVQATLVETIQAPGRVLLLCDGGNKPREVNTFADHLKSGDVIMGHDYCPNVETYREKGFCNVWPWWELRDRDVNPAIVRNGLLPFHAPEMGAVAWFSAYKP